MFLSLDRSISPSSASVFDEEGRAVPGATQTQIESADSDAYALALAALDDASIAITDITRIAVAVGPGSFSGIRSALALAQGMAMPIDAEVIGVPTPAAIWRAFVTEHPEITSGIVIGDARRGRLWVWRSDESPLVPPRLIPLSDCTRLTQNTPIVTPDLKRLSPLFPSAISALPISRAVGELALEGIKLPPLPIYLNAPVE